jgi:hypothetical protein
MAGPSANDSRAAGHAKTVSVGNAASLFGAPAGEDDFFGGLSSKAPAFDDIGEVDETAFEAETPVAHRPPAGSPAREVAADLFGGVPGDTADWLDTATNGQAPPAADLYSQSAAPEQAYGQYDHSYGQANGYGTSYAAPAKPYAAPAQAYGDSYGQSGYEVRGKSL